LFKKNDYYTYIQPEQISSIEFGYRSQLFNNRLQLDVDFYFNTYQGFIAQVELNIPKTSNPDSIAFYLADRQKQDRYRLWTNSKTTAYNYGSGLGLKYKLFKGFNAIGNVTYARLDRKSSNDGLEDGFNTPEWMTNISIGNEKIFRSLGFMVTYRWQSSYYWQSFLVNGNVPAYQTVDAQINFTFEKVHLKIGGTNIFNRYYYSFLGGPYVGGFYYTTISVNL
jgi:iron complex outermembrane receptor protein